MHKLTNQERKALQKKVLSDAQRRELEAKTSSRNYHTSADDILNADAEARRLLAMDDEVRRNEELAEAISLALDSMGTEERKAAKAMAERMTARYMKAQSVRQVDAIYYSYRDQSLPSWAELWNGRLHESRRSALMAAA